MCLLQCLVITHSKGCLPFASYTVRGVTKIYIFLKRSIPSEGFMIILYNTSVKTYRPYAQTCLQSSLRNRLKRQNHGKYIIDFTYRLPNLLLIHLTRERLFLGVLEKLSFCYNHKKKKLCTRYKRICVTCKLKKKPLPGAS